MFPIDCRTMSGEQFSLVWNSFPRNLSSGLYTLLTDEHLVDVTLAAEGQILRAHKLILSVCSTYFRELFKGNSCKHPIVILKDVNYRDLSAMLHFMYQGEVNIKQEDIASFLKVAETLQIKGLTKDTQSEEKFSKEAEELDQLLQADKNDAESVEPDTCLETFENMPGPREDVDFNLQEANSSRENPEVPTDREMQSDETANRPGTENETEHAMQNIRNMFTEHCGNAEQSSSTGEEPLDYTSDVGRFTKTKQEPPDYAFGVEADAGYKHFRMNKTPRPEGSVQNQDFVPNSQLMSYNPSCQDESIGLHSSEAPFQGDFAYDSTSYSRGRRTVKGIPGSSLPLETTLRVVSELGPTLRMERGKVIRMYSCPWCLRHFTRKENLKLHVRYIHGPLESLTCKLCGNKYKNSNSLRVHSYLYHNAKRNKHNKPPLVSGNA
ncbi:broad-complex core protein isoforms 1/2/3/4/5 isoform X2 [Orussus abietinus]|uniref:broad-complex core protein isoforms 1/2/3/4/5 isoform X2 n=1 Tax=Orussus abietinus TaxID=222816 RepID=UPI000625FBD9|nr:broad-complex core protein isoforms 1/2/3/4/5 isoform X2 [Orussus abietinus]